jgi:hypothetical protein
VVRADEEVTFPVAGHGAIVGRGGALPNGHGVDDAATSTRCRALRATIGAALRRCAASAFFSTPRLCTNRLR